ncbi:hypothetical protein [Crenothrix polyspora]|uniref:Uncharacterized protein n=1 Tax=Crenothrix polyspora TaxID=360316 RepID=A0A1R4GZN0_9GAMM|nr:hypothetical protein [Crenothrix polyspora]SJM89437.1 conserved hypothetical protein [Crenothrix polyspora]
MIGALIMIFSILWVYQSAVRGKVSNPIIWVIGCVAVFFASQTLLIWGSVDILESLRGGEADANYERDLMSVGDRKNMGGFQGAKGTFISVFMELMPPMVGFLVIAVIRSKFMLKESLSIGNLFGGLKEMFQSIKQSFKVPE